MYKWSFIDPVGGHKKKMKEFKIVGMGGTLEESDLDTRAAWENQIKERLAVSRVGCVRLCWVWRVLGWSPCHDWQMASTGKQGGTVATGCNVSQSESQSVTHLVEL